MRAATAALFILALAGLTPASAQSSDACGQFKWSIAREQAAFSGDLPNVGSGAAAPAGDTAIAVALAAQDSVAYTVKPARRPRSAPAFGAEITAAVAQAGTYQVTLSTQGWVDLAQGGKTLRSSGFADKAGCPGVRKSVRFKLDQGPVTIAISDVPADSLKLALLPTE